jgi:hypothetical protein
MSKQRKSKSSKLDVDGLEMMVMRPVCAVNPTRPTIPCGCGDESCYGFVRYSEDVRSSGKSARAHRLKTDDDGDLIVDTLDVEVSHIVPCIVVSSGTYTAHVRTASGRSVIFDRIAGDRRQWPGGLFGWLHTFASEDQHGLYRAFIPALQPPTTALSLWFGLQGATPR